MADFLNLNHKYYGRIGSGGFDTSLPIQTIPKSKKNKKWQKLVMDRLEHIALNQLCENLKFVDYRDMTQGRLVHQDLSDTSETTQSIAQIGKDHDLPAYIKHFDIIGVLANQLVGEFNSQKDSIRVDSIDPFSRNEMFAEKNKQIVEYTKQAIQLEIQKGLAERGISEEGQEFESQEEQQQYLQFVQQQKDEIVPPDEIERRLSVDFKVAIVEWAEAVLEADYSRFDMENLDTEELLDYILTGRYFRHYHIGYDYYKPETWKPETTFFSQDLNITYPQDGEYVGQTLFLAPSDILQRYGEKIPKKIQDKLYETEYTTNQSDSVTLEESIRHGFTEVHSVPYKSYYQRDLAHSVQSALGVPMGKTYFENENGEQDSKTTWLQDDRHFGSITNKYATALRKDIEVRTDTMTVTEAYFRSYKLHGVLTLESQITDEPYQITVDEDILDDFIRDNDISNIKTVSLEEAEENKEVDTIAWFWVPVVYQGKKINASNTQLKEDFIFDFKEMDFQIRGDSNLFDVKLPVAGVITSGIAQKIRPYQVKHNLAMNLIENTLEKHVGSFMMFDYNFLGSQYKNEIGETTAELVEAWRENIKDTGFAFYDSSPGNTAGRNPNAAVGQQISISHVQDIQYYMQLAQMYKREAYEQIGITQARVGNPNEYMTTEGIKQGVQASYAQTEIIYKRFNTAKIKEKELHLRVAQYAVKNNKDIVVDYLKPEGVRILKKFTDDNFWLRKMNVKPISDSSQRKSLEQFRNMMVQNNTLGADLLDYAKLFTSDSFVSLISYAEDVREENDKKIAEQKEHESKLAQQQSQTILQKQQMQIDHENQKQQKEIMKDIKVAEIRSIASLADNNLDKSYISDIQKTSAEAVREQQGERGLELKEREIQRKESSDETQRVLALKKANKDLEELNLKREKMKNDRYIAEINKN